MYSFVSVLFIIFATGDLYLQLMNIMSNGAGRTAENSFEK